MPRVPWVAPTRGHHARAGAGTGTGFPDLGHVRVPGLDGQLPDLNLLHRCLDQNAADPDAAICRGESGPHHRRHLVRPRAAGRPGPRRGRPAGRPAQACGLLGMSDEPKPCDFLVNGDFLLTLDATDRTFNRGAIAISDRTIVDIGPADEL